MFFAYGRVSRRLYKLCIVAISIITFVIFTSTLSSSSYEIISLRLFEKGSIFDSLSPKSDTLKDPFKSNQFWKDIFAIFEENKVSYTDEELNNQIRYTDKSVQKKGVLTEESLLSRAYVSEGLVKELGSKHKNILNSLPDEIPHSLYNSDTTGVVLVGGGRFSWLSNLALIGLRESGSNLPVEIMMPTYEDYEQEKGFCKEISLMNAACVVIPERLGEEVNSKWKYASYQLKSLAIITSSFQNVLLLDSDNIPIQNPEHVFESDLFKEYGLITWPDYWPRTVHPAFYEIAGIKVNGNKRVRKGRYELKNHNSGQSVLGLQMTKDVPYHDLEGAIPDVSTESGQLIINKATHGRSLLLSLYYNVNGPNTYYKLLGLGQPGEGDKDTFVTAAVVTGQKFYQVKNTIQTFGYFDENNDFHGVAMGQKNPVDDEKLYKNQVLAPLKNTNMPLAKQLKYLEQVHGDYFDSHKFADLFTLHCNIPKLNPIELINKEDIYDSKKNRLKHRIFPHINIPRYFDGETRSVEYRDFEHNIWTTIEHLVCNKPQLFTILKDVDQNHICQFASNQVQALSPSNI